MSVYAVSDLHIAGVEDPLYASLLALLKRVGPGDTLVLAGDLFDLFVGRKRVFLDRYTAFQEELKRAGARGARIHYIEGNHDFLIQGAFAGVQGLTIHPRDFSLEIEGKRFYFSHGDTVDRADLGYLALRGFFRSPVMKALVAAIPGSWLDLIGQASSRRSRERRPVLPALMPLPRMDRLRKTYRNFAAERVAQGYDFVVMGHCHDLDEMSFVVGGHAGQYVNVGYPRVHGSFLSWNPGDDKIHREKLPV